MAKIYLSSTYSDLKEHREVVYRALRKMRHDVIAMEHYVAADQRPLDKCLEDVCSCDLYIGLFAWRYGYVPLENNPEQQSITELEYQTAVKHGKPALLFLLDENAPWLPKWMDSQTGEGNAGALILALRQEFLRDKLVSTFQGKEDIANGVLHAVHDWEKRHHLNTPTGPFVSMRTKYLEQVYLRYSSVKLPIGSPRGLSLHAIFQPLTLRRDPLVVENLTRDKRRALLGETSEEYERRQNSDGLDDTYPATQEVTAENALEALKKSHQQRMVILGGPGTGKTTTLKYLSAQQANEALENSDMPVPIYISLAALARSGKSLQRYLLDIVEDMEVDPAYADLLWQDIQRGQAYVCLDSLDEVDPKRRSDMIDLVNRKAQEPGNVWIVGSRFTEYKGGQFKAGQFSEWEIQPMSAALRKELANRLFPELCICMEIVHQETPTAEKFVSALEQHPRASAWGENPLLFSLAAVVFLQQGHLPASHILLYQQVVEAVLATREPDPIRQKILLRMLTELALWIHQQRGRTFTTEDLITFFVEEQHRSWGETGDLTRAVINSGIVEIVARQTYGFRHQTFQEYLAASELARRLAGMDTQLREQAEAFIWGKRTYNRWTEVLRLMVGAIIQFSGKKGYLEAIHWLGRLLEQRSMPEGDPGHLGLTLTIKSLAEVTHLAEWKTRKAIQLEQHAVSLWLDGLLDAKRERRDIVKHRLSALVNDVVHLQQCDRETVSERLVQALKDFNIESGLLEKLGKWIPIKLLNLMLEDKYAYVRRTAVKALATQGDRVSLESLLPMLKDQDKGVRSAAVEALADRVPLESLLAFLQDKASGVRETTIKVLAAQGDRVPLESLLPMLKDQDRWVRQTTVQALAVQGDRVPLEPLLALLHNPMADVRQTAVKALAAQGNRVSPKSLLPMLKDKDGGVRSVAIQALAAQGKCIPLEFLLVSLHAKSADVREAAIQALASYGNAVPLEPLFALVHDQTWSVHKAAMQALAAQGDRVPLEPLLALLHDKASWVRQSAAQVLAVQGERVPLESLLALPHDQVADIRSVAIQVLTTQGDCVPPEPLLALLHDDDFWVRRLAIEALAAQGDRVPLEPLLASLRDKDSLVQQTAIRALAARSDRVPLKPLLDLLEDKDSWIRWTAIEALGERIPPKSLLARLQDKDSRVRRTAIGALVSQGHGIPLEVCFVLLAKAYHEDERQAILQALAAQSNRVPLEPFFALLENKEWSVRRVAVQALATQGQRVILKPLLTLLENKDEEVAGWLARWVAVQVLATQGNRVPLDPLLPMLKDEDEEVRSTAVKALAARGEHVLLEPLLTLLQDQIAQVRAAAVEALAAQCDRVPLKPLLALLKDEDEEVRSTAVKALAAQGERVPLKPLLLMLKDQDEWVRCAAVQALATQVDRVPFDSIFALLYDDVAYVRAATIEAIATQGKSIPLDSLFTLLEDKDKNVRYEAAQVLALQSNRFPLTHLLPLLKNEDEGRREAAVMALGNHAKCIELETLFMLITDEEYDVRLAAMQVLKVAPSETVSEVVAEAVAILRDSAAIKIFQPLIQMFIAATLGDLGYCSPRLLAKLTDLLDWPHRQVRLKAIEALGKIRRNIPDEAIRRLLVLQRDTDPHNRAVQKAADDALAEILSLETGIEDD